jgi:hypothetical protein
MKATPKTAPEFYLSGKCLQCFIFPTKRTVSVLLHMKDNPSFSFHAFPAATPQSTNHVSPLFVRLHYRRAKIPFTPRPKIPPFFGTMFAVQPIALTSSHKNSEKKFMVHHRTWSDIQNCFIPLRQQNNKVFARNRLKRCIP